MPPKNIYEDQNCYLFDFIRLIYISFDIIIYISN